MANIDQMFRVLFVKAFRDGEVSVPAGDLSSAKGLRFKLYAFGRKARAQYEKDHLDFELQEALDGVNVKLEGTAVRVSRKDREVLMQSVLEALGGEAGLAEFAGEDQGKALVEESMKRFLEKMEAEPEKPARVTPYYTRDD